VPGMEEAKRGWLPFALFTMATGWGEFLRSRKKVYDYMTTTTTWGEGVALLSLFIAPEYIRGSG
jgi:hypothetical protein